MTLKSRRQKSMRAVFLDRDGVINEAIIKNRKPYPPKSITDLKILPGVSNSLTTLKNKGWFLIVVTNQPDVARGVTTKRSVEAINQRLQDCLPINKFFTCYHDDDDKCDCRKPSPGALIKSANTYDINLSESFMIGDRWRDIEAGKSAGCKTIFINYGYDEKQPLQYDYTVGSLVDATKIILGESNEKN